MIIKIFILVRTVTRPENEAFYVALLIVHIGIVESFMRM